MPLCETLTTFTEQLIYTAEKAKASYILSQRLALLLLFDIAQLVAEQMAMARNNIAKLIAKQIALALAAHRIANIQSPSELSAYGRQEIIISSVEPLETREICSQDGPMRGTDAQELSNKANSSFEA